MPGLGSGGGESHGASSQWHVILAIGLGGLLVASALGPAGVRVNLSPSLPIGLYVARPVSRSQRPNVHWGALVMACLPPAVAQWGRVRGYLMRGSCADGVAPVGKAVFAVSGDTVVVTDDGLAVHGVLAPNSRPLAEDARGRPLARVANGRRLVARGEVWLVSTHSPRSWDSRYYGPVPVARVMFLLKPLWVMRTSQ